MGGAKGRAATRSPEETRIACVGGTPAVVGGQASGRPWLPAAQPSGPTPTLRWMALRPMLPVGIAGSTRAEKTLHRVGAGERVQRRFNFRRRARQPTGLVCHLYISSLLGSTNSLPSWQQLTTRRAGGRGATPLGRPAPRTPGWSWPSPAGILAPLFSFSLSPPPCALLTHLVGAIHDHELHHRAPVQRHRAPAAAPCYCREFRIRKWWCVRREVGEEVNRAREEQSVEEGWPEGAQRECADTQNNSQAASVPDSRRVGAAGARPAGAERHHLRCVWHSENVYLKMRTCQSMQDVCH